MPTTPAHLCRWMPQQQVGAPLTRAYACMLLAAVVVAVVEVIVANDRLAARQLDHQSANSVALVCLLVDAATSFDWRTAILFPSSFRWISNGPLLVSSNAPSISKVARRENPLGFSRQKAHQRSNFDGHNGDNNGRVAISPIISRSTSRATRSTNLTVSGPLVSSSAASGHVSTFGAGGRFI